MPLQVNTQYSDFKSLDEKEKWTFNQLINDPTTGINVQWNGTGKVDGTLYEKNGRYICDIELQSYGKWQIFPRFPFEDRYYMIEDGKDNEGKIKYKHGEIAWHKEEHLVEVYGRKDKFFGNEGQPTYVIGFNQPMTLCIVFSDKDILESKYYGNLHMRRECPEDVFGIPISKGTIIPCNINNNEIKKRWFDEIRKIIREIDYKK